MIKTFFKERRRIRLILSIILCVTLFSSLKMVLFAASLSNNSEADNVAYTVSFLAQDASYTEPQTISEGGLVLKPQDPVLSKHLFKEWMLNGMAYDFNLPVYSDFVLEASFEKIVVGTPVILSVDNNEFGVLKTTLEAMENIDGFEIVTATNSTFTSGVQKDYVTNLTDPIESKRADVAFGKRYYVKVRAYKIDSIGDYIYGKYCKSKALTITNADTVISASSSASKITNCKIIKGNKVEVKAIVKNLVSSYDTSYYLFSLAPYASSISRTAIPADEVAKQKGANLEHVFYADLNLNTTKSRLFQKYVIAVKDPYGNYAIISKSKFISNPDYIAGKTFPYPQMDSKKGLQVEPTHDSDVDKLGIKHATININMDQLFATANEKKKGQAIPYIHNERTYYFSSKYIGTLDAFTKSYTSRGATCYGVLLMRYRSDLLELIHPRARQAGYPYYTINAGSSTSRRYYEALFTFLGNRYANEDATGSQGQMVNWILGNEVNIPNMWNYAGDMSITEYGYAYADAFRMLDTAMKSAYSGARCYISLDQNWGAGGNVGYAGRSLLYYVNVRLNSQGKVPVNVAFHPYASPLTASNFWSDGRMNVSNSAISPVVSMYNLSYITKDIKSMYGPGIHIILSEQGYSSGRYLSNLNQQTAAILYAYYLAEFNPDVDAFILHRAVDHMSEVSQGLNLGLMTCRGEYGGAPTNLHFFKKKSWFAYRAADDYNQYNSVFKTEAVINQNNDIVYLTINMPAYYKIIRPSATSWKDLVPGFDPNRFRKSSQQEFCEIGEAYSPQ